MIDNKQPSVLASLDWWTIGLYLALLIFGWVSVCGASYNYGDNEIFSLGARSGMQIIWIGTSIALGLVILLLDDLFLRYLLVCHLWRPDTLALCYDIQSA